MPSTTTRLLGLTLPILLAACTSEPADTSADASAPTCEAPATTPFATTWAKAYTSDVVPYGGADRVSAVAIDHEGNLVVGGAYSGNLSLGEDTLPGMGPENAFLVGYAPSGARIWQAGFPTTTIARVLPVRTGGLVVAGWFDGSVDFGGGPLEGGIGTTGFLLRLDASGHHVWSRAIGGGVASVSLSDAGLAPDGTMVVAGAFAGTVDFGSGPRQSVGDLNNGFAAAFDAKGRPLWDQVFGASGVDSSPTDPDVKITRVATDDDGRIALLGTSNGYVEQMDGSYTSDTHAFLVGLDESGALAWQRSFAPLQDTGPYSAVIPTALAMTPDGDVLVGGTVWQTNDLWQPPAPGSSGAPVHAAFLVRLRPGGEPRWTATYALSDDSSYGEDQIDAIETDGCTVTLAGNARAIDFGGGPLGTNGPATAFVAQLQGDAHFIRGAGFGQGSSTVSALTIGHDHVVVGGMFEGTIALPGSPIDSGGAYQGFAAVLGP